MNDRYMFERIPGIRKQNRFAADAIEQLLRERNKAWEALGRIMDNYAPVAHGCNCSFCQYLREVKEKTT